MNVEYNSWEVHTLITYRSGEVRKFLDQESQKNEVNAFIIVYQMI